MYLFAAGYILRRYRDEHPVSTRCCLKSTGRHRRRNTRLVVMVYKINYHQVPTCMIWLSLWSVKRLEYVSTKNCSVGHWTSEPVVFWQNKNNRNAGERSGHWCVCPSTKGTFASPGIAAPRKFEIVLCKILQYSAFLAGKWFAMPSIMRSWTLTMGTAFLHVTPRNDPRCEHHLEPLPARYRYCVGSVYLNWQLSLSAFYLKVSASHYCKCVRSIIN